MNPSPRIFISATSAEFKTARQKVANVLHFLGYEADLQEIFGTEPGDLRQMLRQKIDNCDGLIQIVGLGYGAEPPTLDPEFGRVSYTQFELLYARQQNKKTWLIFATEESYRDTPIDALDLPLDRTHDTPDRHQAKRRDLQSAFRSQLANDEHLKWTYSNDAELENLVLRLRSDSEELRKEFRSWQGSVLEGFQDLHRQIDASNHRSWFFRITTLVLLICVVVWVTRHTARQTEERAQPIADRAKTVDLDLGIPPKESQKQTAERKPLLSYPFQVEYSASKANGVLNISPKSPYFDALESGDVIPTVGRAPYFEWAYPRLSAKVHNAAENDCYITEAVINVKSSRINHDPLFVAQSRGGGYVSIINEGWGPPLLNEEGTLEATLELGDNHGGFIERQVALDEFFTIDCSKCLTQKDLRLARNQPEGRPFKASIHYSTPSGKTKTFRCEGMVDFSPPPAPYFPPTREPYDVFLPAGKEGFQTIVPLSQVIPAGGVDHFEIRIATDKSAQFELQIQFKDVSGNIIADRQVALTTFIAPSGKVRGTVPPRKRVRLGEPKTLEKMQVTLVNVALANKDPFTEVMHAFVEVKNRGDSELLWQLDDMEEKTASPRFLQMTDVALNVCNENGEYGVPIPARPDEPWECRIPAGQSNRLVFEFSGFPSDLGDFFISMKLRGRSSFDEAAFRASFPPTPK